MLKGDVDLPTNQPLHVFCISLFYSNNSCFYDFLFEHHNPIVLMTHVPWKGCYYDVNISARETLTSMSAQAPTSCAHWRSG